MQEPSPGQVEPIGPVGSQTLYVISAQRDSAFRDKLNKVKAETILSILQLLRGNHFELFF